MAKYLTVPELADLLRIKERKVYDLAASGRVPCSRATGRLLFPEAEIRAWIARESTGRPPPDSVPEVFLGSHDPLLDWALAQSRCGLATYFDGSLDGLSRFRAGEGVAAGLHLATPSGGWNVERVAAECHQENAALMGWAWRSRGLVTRRDGPGLSGLGDLRGRPVIPRQPESGTDTLFRKMLGEAGVSVSELSWGEVARSEIEAVQGVAEGRGEVTFGLETLAASFGLAFVPIVEERFDLLIDRKSWFDPPMRALLGFCQSEAFAERAAAMTGYDIAPLGQVRWNA